MVGAVFHRSMNYFTAWAAVVIPLNRCKPFAWVAGIFWHMRQNQGCVLHDIFHLAQVDPNAENAASAFTLAEGATLQRFNSQ